MKYAQKLALYQKLLATRRVRRKGDKMPHTSLKGNIYSLLTKEGTLILRLDPDSRAALFEKYECEPIEQLSAAMTEYVAIPDALLTNPRELKEYFDLSYTYAKSLKANRPKEKKTKKKR
jgi:TfoX/Sxy family transcriptional regulator of competence genes